MMKFRRDAGIELNGLIKEAEHLADEEKTPMLVALAGRAAGRIAVVDTLKAHEQKSKKGDRFIFHCLSLWRRG